MILLDLASRVRVFIWSFISGGRVSVMVRISSGSFKGGFEDEDEDGSVTGYTHKGGGMTVVLRVRGFLEK